MKYSDLTRRSFVAAAMCAAAPANAPFRWPDGKRAAISLTFDDARLSQPETGIPLLDSLGVKATFYLVPRTAEKRLDGWKKATANGHEMGNHSRSHPCTANYRFSAANGLEEYTPARMQEELDGANADIERLLGVKPVSFAYPCGQKFIGRGADTQSYVPLVAKRFLTGRGYLDESANDPNVCDLANLMGTALDELSFTQMQKLVDAAAKESRWMIFVGHEIGRTGFQTTSTEALERLCRYAKDAAHGLWIDTVANVARYVAAQRKPA